MNTASLFDALITGNARKVADELFPQSPQQPMSRCPDLVEGLSPRADTGTAGVSDLPGSYRAQVYALELVINRLHDLLPDNVDEAYVLVQKTYRAIHGR